MHSPQRAPGRGFALSLAMTALITPLAVHLFFPVIPAIKVAMGINDAYAQFTFSVALFGMALATLFYGSLSDRYSGCFWSGASSRHSHRRRPPWCLAVSCRRSAQAAR